MSKPTQGWETQTVYRVMGQMDRVAILSVFEPVDEGDLKQTKEVAVGAGIIVNFLKAELSPQMLDVVLAMLYSQGQRFFDAAMGTMAETLKLQREVIKSLQPPPEVITLVEREIEWLASKEDKWPLEEWLEAVTAGESVYDSEEGGDGTGRDGGDEAGAGEGGEEDTDDDRGEETVGAGVADDGP